MDDWDKISKEDLLQASEVAMFMQDELYKIDRKRYEIGRAHV